MVEAPYAGLALLVHGGEGLVIELGPGKRVRASRCSASTYVVGERRRGVYDCPDLHLDGEAGVECGWTGECSRRVFGGGKWRQGRVRRKEQSECQLAVLDLLLVAILSSDHGKQGPATRRSPTPAIPSILSTFFP